MRPRIGSAGALIVALTIACAENPTGISGILFASNGGGIVRQIDLESGSTAKTPDYGYGPANIAQVGDDEFAIDHCDSWGACEIKIVGKTGAVTSTITNGVNPVAVRELGRLLFYRKNDGIGWSLVLAELRSPESSTQLIGDIRKSPMTAAIVRVGRSRIALVDDERNLLTVDLASGEVAKHEVTGVAPRAWRSSTSTLLGYRYASREAVEVDLESGQVRELGFSNPQWGFVYLPDSDQLLFSRGRTAWLVTETADLFLWDFASGDEARVAKDIQLFSGFVGTPAAAGL